MKSIVFIDETAQLGGAEINLLQSLSWLEQNGWKPLVFLPGDGPLVQKLKEKGISVRVVPGGPFYSVSSYFLGHKIPNPLAWLITWMNGLIWAARLERTLREVKPALVQTVSLLAHLFGGYAARRAGIPLVAHIQDIVAPASGLGLNPLIFQRWAGQVPDRLVCISPLVARQFQDNPKAAPKTVMIWNMIDSGRFSPSGMPSSGEGKVRIGTAARLTRWKGQYLALQVASNLKARGSAFHWYFLGDAALGDENYARELRQFVYEHGLEGQVTFLGWRDDPRSFYQSLDLLVHLPSEPEPFGLVLGEALACGVPVVSTPGGLDDVIRESGGRLVPVGDPIMVADAILQDWPVDAPQTARAAALKYFSASQIVPNWLHLYTDLAPDK